MLFFVVMDWLKYKWLVKSVLTLDLLLNTFCDLLDRWYRVADSWGEACHIQYLDSILKADMHSEYHKKELSFLEALI